MAKTFPQLTDIRETSCSEACASKQWAYHKQSKLYFENCGTIYTLMALRWTPEEMVGHAFEAL